MRELAQAFRPHVWMNAHSGMEALFMPYDHRAEVPATPEAASALQLLGHLNQIACGGRCAVGSGGKSVGAPPPHPEHGIHAAAACWAMQIMHWKMLCCGLRECEWVSVALQQDTVQHMRGSRVC